MKDELNDELRPEYDLTKLKVRRLGPGHKRVNRLADDDNLRSRLRNRYDQLLNKLDLAHVTYYKDDVFRGPSLYFHQEALRAGKAKDLKRFSEMTYAVLASWGMHRMGSGGSKMKDFDAFQQSLKKHWESIVSLQEVNPHDMDESKWDCLQHLFRGISCMATATSLVGNSKVLAHALPKLIPPVDREYTLMFLRGNKNIKNDIQLEWCTLRGLLEGFFYPMLEAEAFRSKINRWMPEPKFQWDTSPLKVIDNLIIGFLRSEKGL